MNLVIAMPRDEDVAYSDKMFTKRWVDKMYKIYEMYNDDEGDEGNENDNKNVVEKMTVEKMMEKMKKMEIMSYHPWENVWWEAYYGPGYCEEIDLSKNGMVRHLRQNFDQFDKAQTKNEKVIIFINIFEYIHTYFAHFEKNFSNQTFFIQTVYNKANESVKMSENDNLKIHKNIEHKLKNITNSLMKKLEPLL
jgi:hypothetical protein